MSQEILKIISDGYYDTKNKINEILEDYDITKKHNNVSNNFSHNNVVPNNVSGGKRHLKSMKRKRRKYSKTSRMY